MRYREGESYTVMNEGPFGPEEVGDMVLGQKTRKVGDVAGPAVSVTMLHCFQG